MKNLYNFTKYIFTLFLFMNNFLFFFIQEKLTSIILTDKGSIQGLIKKTSTNYISYSSFTGIPYAKAPIKNLRFKPPIESEPWNNIFLATSNGNVCPQLEGFNKKYIGDEDCLYLNIYTPKIDFQNKNINLLPVIVFFHGGKFENGDNNPDKYGPDFFIDENIIYVGPQFRLGAFGLLALDHPDATGNAMLKDQTLSLLWVQKNIIKFGGNPNNVTIMGQSSGGPCVDLHLISKSSQGLFQKSISISGTVLAPWGFSKPKEALNRAFKLANLLDIKTTNKTKILEILYNKTPKEIILASEKIVKGDRVFKPTIENKKTAGNNAFLIECPIKCFKNGNFKNFPHLSGFAKNEIMVFAKSTEMLLDYTKFALESMDLVLNNEIKKKLLKFAQRLSNTTNNELSQFSNEFVMNVINLLSDVLTINSIDTKQQLMTNSSSTLKFYYYKNTFDGESESFHKKYFNINYDGVSHGDLLPFLFYIKNFYKIFNPNERLILFGNKILKLWSNFIKYGNPTPNGTLDPLLNITWPSSDKIGIYLDLGDELVIRQRLINKNIKILQKAQLNGIDEKLNCGI